MPDDVRKCTVLVRIPDRTGSGISYGTGAVVGRTSNSEVPNVIVTNAHVVEDGGSIGSVRTADGQWHPVTVLAPYDTGGGDLALLKVSSTRPLPEAVVAVPLAQHKLPLRTEVYRLGYPGGDSWGRLARVSKPYITTYQAHTGTFWAVDLGGSRSYEGESGGPIISESGELVGVNWGQGSAIQVGYLQEMLERYHIVYRIPDSKQEDNPQVAANVAAVLNSADRANCWRPVPGKPGPRGPGIVPGSVATGAPGTNVQAKYTRVGNQYGDWRLDLTVPKGADGNNGTATSIRSVTVETIEPGQPARGQISEDGTHLYLWIPKGVKGDIGNPGNDATVDVSGLVERITKLEQGLTELENKEIAQRLSIDGTTVVPEHRVKLKNLNPDDPAARFFGNMTGTEVVKASAGTGGAQ